MNTPETKHRTTTPQHIENMPKLQAAIYLRMFRRHPETLDWRNRYGQIITTYHMGRILQDMKTRLSANDYDALTTGMQGDTVDTAPKPAPMPHWDNNGPIQAPPTGQAAKREHRTQHAENTRAALIAAASFCNYTEHTHPQVTQTAEHFLAWLTNAQENTP